MIKHYGILKFDPQPMTRNVSTGKISKQLSEPFCLLMVGGEFDRFYRWLLWKRYNLYLTGNAWGGHITAIRKEVQLYDQWAELKAKYENTKVEFEYDPDPKSDGYYWWLKVISSQLEDIRESMGLNRRTYWGYHLTIGYPREKDENFSQYIKNIKEYNDENNFEKFIN